MGPGLNVAEKTFWHGRRVLVTGHTGFKGTWLTRWLDLMGSEVLGVSLPRSADPAELWCSTGIEVAEANADLAVRGWEDSVRDFGPEVVLHLAAQSLVPVGYQDPLRTFTTNVQGTARIMDLVSSLTSVEAALVITTDKVYDPRQRGAHTEESYLGGIDPYSASKAAAELLVHSWPTGQRLIATARAGNVIGGGDWSAHRLIPDLVRSWANNQPLELRRPDAVRPWQHVLEPLHGYLMYAEALVTGNDVPTALNLGPDQRHCVSVRHLTNHAAEVWREAGGDLPDPPTRAEETAPFHETGLLELDSSCAQERLGWSNVLDWQESVSWTLDWYLAHRRGAAPLALIDQQIADYEARLQAAT